MSESKAPLLTLSPVLITGGCGFFGWHLTKKLLEEEHSCDIHVLDVNTSRRRIPGVTYHEVDITDGPAVEAIMQESKPRTIFHTACPDSMVVLPKLFAKVNVGGTNNLLASAEKVGSAQALVHTSTSSVIHDNLHDLVDADETLPILRPPQQKRVYTLTKADAEEAVQAANRKHGDASILTTNIRPATGFGEDDTICLGKMFATAQKGAMKFQMGSGNNMYDFVYVGNLADAHILAARALLRDHGHLPPPPDRRVDGECFNITNDEPILFWDFARKIAAAAGKPVRREDIIIVPKFIGLFFGWVNEWVVWLITGFSHKQPNMTQEGIRFSTMTRTLNIEKAKSVLGYRPKVGIDEGVQKSVDWFLKLQEEEAQQGKQ